MTANRWYVAAMCFGLVHGLASGYWLLGGEWLLDTLGPWAVELKDERPLLGAAVLVAATLVKGAAAVLPWLNHHGRLPAPGLWRAVAWVGAPVLVVYGGANMVGGVIGLSGLLGPVEHSAALWGHAAIWDPLFLLWGIALLAALVAERAGRRTTIATTAEPVPAT